MGLRRPISKLKSKVTAHLRERKLAVLRDIAYGTGGGRPLLLDLLAPAVAKAERAPAVVWIHGGGWEHGGKNGSPAAAMLAKAGFVTASISYRLSGEAPFPAQIEDCKCAVRFLRANAARFGIDPARIAVAGSSAGGHLAELVATAGPDAGLEGDGGWQGVSSRVRAAAAWFGVSDFTDGALEFHPRLGRVVVKLFGGPEKDKPELYRLASPVCHVAQGAAPMLLAHGEEDGLVPFDQSARMAAAYRQAGLEMEFIPVRHAGHDFKRVGEAAISPAVGEIHARTIDFLRRRLGVEAAGEP
jgi:acetyl esterase/lipase